MIALFERVMLAMFLVYVATTIMVHLFVELWSTVK